MCLFNVINPVIIYFLKVKLRMVLVYNLASPHIDSSIHAPYLHVQVSFKFLLNLEPTCRSQTSHYHDVRPATELWVQNDPKFVQRGSIIHFFMGIIPGPIPTPMGIPRLFITSTHSRRLGIARRLLKIAPELLEHPSLLILSKVQVAFSQPTSVFKRSLLECSTDFI